MKKIIGQEAKEIVRYHIEANRYNNECALCDGLVTEPVIIETENENGAPAHKICCSDDCASEFMD